LETGAGDVFHGAFLFGLLQGWEARDILVFANAVSALKCTRLGGRARIPGAEEVRAFLATRGHILPGTIRP
jgi:sugar/nucleoside kinase (ribokinase family)